MKNIRSKLPESVKGPLRFVRKFIRKILYYGKGRFCPVCGNSSSSFASFGRDPRDDAQCVHCGALERHRFVWLFFNKKTNLFDGNKKIMLHVAPEQCFEPILKARLGSSYLTADLYNPRAMVKMDICDIQYPDESFDVIYCSHVLEHVVEDKKAMREFYRVLKTDGWAILNVPIFIEETYEDPSITDPAERLKAFGQEDHVRCYGADYVDRLRDAGFKVEIYKVEDLADAEEIIKMGLTNDSGDIFYCTK